MGNFYKAVVQAVLLYGAETWTLTETMKTKLNTFHHRVSRHLVKDHIRPDPLDSSQWVLPESTEVLHKAGLLTIEQYIKKRRITLKSTVEKEGASYSNLLRICLRVRKPRPLSWWAL